MIIQRRHWRRLDPLSVGQDKTPGMQMQAPGNHPTRMRGLTAIFAIAHDGMADMRHVHAQLVRRPVSGRSATRA